MSASFFVQTLQIVLHTDRRFIVSLKTRSFIPVNCWFTIVLGKLSSKAYTLRNVKDCSSKTTFQFEPGEDSCCVLLGISLANRRTGVTFRNIINYCNHLSPRKLTSGSIKCFSLYKCSNFRMHIRYTDKNLASLIIASLSTR